VTEWARPRCPLPKTTRRSFLIGSASAGSPRTKAPSNRHKPRSRTC